MIAVEDVQLNGLQLVRIDRMDTFRHSLHQRIVGRILPGIKVVAVQPKNIGKALVAFT